MAYCNHTPDIDPGKGDAMLPHQVACGYVSQRCTKCKTCLRIGTAWFDASANAERFGGWLADEAVDDDE